MRLEFAVDVTDEEAEKLKVWEGEQLKKCESLPKQYTYFEYIIRRSPAGDYLQVNCLPTKEKMIIDGFHF